MSEFYLELNFFSTLKSDFMIADRGSSFFFFKLYLLERGHARAGERGKRRGTGAEGEGEAASLLPC